MRGGAGTTAWSAAMAAAVVVFSAGTVQATGDRALGEYLSSECATCHQASGRQVGGIPSIIGHPADQFVVLMDAYRQRHRENRVMQAIAARLSDEEIAALAAYYGSLKPTP